MTYPRILWTDGDCRIVQTGVGVFTVEVTTRSDAMGVWAWNTVDTREAYSLVVAFAERLIAEQDE